MAQASAQIWEVYEAFSGEADCQSKAATETRAWQKFRERTADSKRSVAGKIDMSWLCLPDTVDPRGPKVK